MFKLLLTLLLLCGVGFSAEPRVPADLKVSSSIVFKEVDGQKLDLILFQPLEKKVEKAPLVVYIHGGGWAGGDKYKVLRRDVIEVVRALNQQGVMCASIEYRLAKGAPVTVNDSETDCKDAMRFLVKHADEYGIDPNRVGTFGSSAGGHLTLLTALSDDALFPGDPRLAGVQVKVRCVAAYFPLVSFCDLELFEGSNFANPNRLIPILGGLLADRRELAKKLSPIEYVRAGSPAIFLAHGDADKVLSFRNSERMRDAAIANGVAVECVLVKGAGHGFAGESVDPSVDEIVQRTTAFFMENLVR